MTNHPTSDNGQPTLPFSPFPPGVGAYSDLIAMALWPISQSTLSITPPSCEASRVASAIPAIEPVIVSPYEVDDFGRPRILSKFEVAFHSLAWRVVVGLLIGVGLAAGLLAVQKAVTPQEQIIPVSQKFQPLEATP